MYHNYNSGLREILFQLKSTLLSHFLYLDYDMKIQSVLQIELNELIYNFCRQTQIATDEKIFLL